ncbi:AAA family ATPase [Umezawaea sp. Da 62-37]|uniref:helix-turn-helix transcriptional regulator n=1 Tax=Umezawaea sp. Da 62-37 TaxID=3075927 RepID=UPI0028F73F77|nr:AAA family ATPase [Umezawaea sp. Da 62-37]WNV84127.1 LuxR C-terminal-related transcriptional regulator [Umezawaea sp. Da 62-37]
MLISRGVAVDAFDGVRRLVLHGPAGIGKSTVARALAGRAPRAVWLAPDAADADLPFAGLAELRGVVPHEVGPITAGVDRLVARGRAAELVRALGPRTLLVLDNAQWLDAESAELLAFALRQAPAGLRVVAVERAHRTPVRAAAVCGEGAARWALPPLAADGIAELLAQQGLRYRWAGRVHALSGGNLALALELGAAIAALDHDLRPFEAVPVPERVRSAVRERWAEVGPDAVRTLRIAALADRPTVAVLHRARGAEVDAHLAEAVAADLVSIDETDHVRFTAGVLASTAGVPHAERLALHGVLAEVVDDPVERARHAALAADEPDADLARRTQEAAAVARAHGNRALAAELGLLAARRTPAADEVALVARSVRAAVDAGFAGHVERAREAANLVLSRSTSAVDRVHARLSLVDVSGQSLDAVDEEFAHAFAEAGGNPALVAAVRLRESWKANLCDGDPVAARAVAADSAELAARGGDLTVRAMALTMQARMERVLGMPSADAVLARALALPVDGSALGVHNSPAYLAVRHALFDDRLVDARAQLLALLPVAERSGSAEDITDVLRSLAEVEARAGRCGAALHHARRAVRTTAEAGLSPGPAWCTAALAEAAGGSFERALDYALRGARASEEEHDRVFLSRTLHAAGTVLLATDRAAEAVGVLERVRVLEDEQVVGDPSILRWHGDLAEALVAVGDQDAARGLITRTRAATDHAGVLVGLDRAEGVLTSDVDLLTAAAARAVLPLERGRTLLALAGVQRRRRRRGAARAVLREAVELFAGLEAHPWTALAQDAVDRLAPRPGAGLTEAEARVAELVGRGASNQQVASALAVSVKTVEATLTRVYRKVGVRSRSQLAAGWAQQPPQL